MQLAVFHKPTRAAPLALFLVSLGFSLLHVLAAAEVKRWAKKRLELGLDGYGFPWQVHTPSACKTAQLLRRWGSSQISNGPPDPQAPRAVPS